MNDTELFRNKVILIFMSQNCMYALLIQRSAFIKHALSFTKVIINFEIPNYK
jgi:hypothetical protein